MTLKCCVMKLLKRLYDDQRGLSVVEYAVAGGFVATVVAASYTTLGQVVSSKIQTVISALG